MIKRSLLLISLLISIFCQAQFEKKVYIDKVKKLCPFANVVNVELKNKYVEVEYFCNGKWTLIGMGLNTKILFTETKVEFPKPIMEKIKDKLNKHFKGWMDYKHTLVEKPDSSFYKVTLINNDQEEYVYFTMHGKFNKTIKTTVNRHWTTNSLSKCSAYKDAPYPFLKPDNIYNMPKTLKEISGISLANKHTMFCIQDESGIVFKYNMEKKELSKFFHFTHKGDFEDLTVVGDIIYILRSDGTLFHFNFKKMNGKTNKTVVPVNSMNVEGLCFDKRTKKMYMACKGQPLNGPITHREIYEFTLSSMKKPVIGLTIDMEEISRWVVKNYPSLHVEDVQFYPSAIAIHPITGEMYILSAHDRLIAIYKKQHLEKVYPLPADIYYKPEGIEFSEKGELYLSSEGIKDDYVKGQIFHFDSQSKTHV